MSRHLVFRAQRDTIALILAATGLTFALSTVIHSHQTSTVSAVPQLPEARQEWAGALAGLTPDSTPVAVIEPLTSASMVVPSSELALPQMPVRPLVKLRGCDGSNCISRPMPAPPTKRATAPVEAAHATQARPKAEHASLMSRLNPMRHLPGMATLSRPFAYAGRTVTGWFRQF